MIRTHSVHTNVTTVPTKNTEVKKKKTTTVTAKRLKGKKSACRKNYKKLKFKLKGLIEEGVILKETLRRKQDCLVEICRDIHYILGRLLPYQKKIATTAGSSKLADQQQSSPMDVSDPFDQEDVKSSKSHSAATWDSYATPVATLDSEKSNHINFSNSTDIEHQLASTVYPLSLPDDIFSES